MPFSFTSSNSAAATEAAGNYSRVGRRGFLAGAGLLGAAALAGCSNDGVVASPTATPSVLDVLNFALNLEYLEASFYAYVATGSGLPAADTGTSPGSVSGGAQVSFANPTVAAIAAQLATDEREHVEFLRATITSLGGTPVDLPALNLAAMGTVNSDATFVALARQLEGVGASAYIGSSALLATNPQALTYAAQILHVESQHAGSLRELCIRLGVSSPAADAQDQPPALNTVFNTNATTGLAPSRTTQQVLGIVFGAPGTTGLTKGGFFPNGLNGALGTS